MEVRIKAYNDSKAGRLSILLGPDDDSQASLPWRFHFGTDNQPVDPSVVGLVKRLHRAKAPLSIGQDLRLVGDDEAYSLVAMTLRRLLL